MTNDSSGDDNTVTLTCEECGRDGDVMPMAMDLQSHRVTIEKPPNGQPIQWQEWDGHWFCHTCLATYAAETVEEAQAHMPENVGDQPWEEWDSGA